MKKRLILLVLTLLTSSYVWSQITITGTVISKEDKEELIGVNVVIKGTKIGTVTDYNGKFSIQVNNPTDTLVFQYVGMITKEFPLKGQTEIQVITKWDCHKDYFDSQHVDLYLSSGILNTPIGGQIEIASPWFLGGVINGLYSYQTNLSENNYHIGQVEFTHYISNCDYDFDFRWGYRNVSFDNSLSFITNSIETDFYTRSIRIIAGYVHLNFRQIELTDEQNLSGILIGFGTRLNMRPYPSLLGKISFYKDKIEYQASIEGSYKRFQCFLKFYKLNTFNELSIGIGTWIGYRLRKQK
jgi:hypothetical protein